MVSTGQRTSLHVEGRFTGGTGPTIERLPIRDKLLSPVNHCHPVEDCDPVLADAVYNALMHSIITDHAANPEDDAAANAVITLLSNLPALAGLTNAERTLMAEWLTRIINPDEEAGGDR